MLEKLQLDTMYATSFKPISFLCYYLNLSYFTGDNTATLYPDTSINSDGRISKKEIERKDLMTKNLLQVELILHKDSTNQAKSPFFGILDRTNERIMIPIFKYDQNLKRGKFVFEFFRFISCNDPLPVIRM